MGGASDLPQRSSSPLKRRASDLEADGSSSQKDDVDMIAVLPDPQDATVTTAQSSRSKRAQSIDMLKDEHEGYALRSKAPVAAQEAEDLPPIDAQIKIVKTLLEASRQHQLQDGDKVWLISKTWLDRVTSRGSEARQNSKVEPEGEVGPVDNSDIIQQIIEDADGEDFVQLKHGIGTECFETFPDDAWKVVMDWYGLMPGSIPIIRYAHNTNADKTGIPNVIYELHPPIFTIHRLWSDASSTIPQIQKTTNPNAPVFVVSRSMPYMEFLKRIKTKAGIDLKKKVRIWRVPRLQPAAEPGVPTANMTTPPSSRPSSPAPGVTVTEVPREPQDSWTALLLDVETFTKLPRGIGRELMDAVPDRTGDENYNGHTDLAFYGLGDNQAIVLDEQLDGTNYVSNYSPRTQGSNLRTNTSNLSNSQPNSGRASPVPYMTRGRTQKASGKTLGTVGLSNLGNTCYMNSALQCVRSVEELTKYFLTGVADTELNYENPLGNHGEVAKAYRNLLAELYKDPPTTSVAPRQFKNTIGKYAPSFSGYAQQDSQEFLGFLLDGLQEDLSRVKKKPYIEKPDSTDEMVNNPEAIREMASKVWDITKKRDDSVIADLFTGMYKSTLVCPVCAKVSITFDPFNNVTLQLPIENTWSHDIYYFPLNDKPIMIAVDMDKQGSILAMKEYMSRKVGVPVERLFVAEEFKHRIYKIHDDNEQACEGIGNNDNIAMYELESNPTNWPAPRKPAKKKKSMLNFSSYGNDSEDEDVPNWQDPLADRMLVPVFYRRPNTERGRSSFRKPWALAALPQFIMLTPEEARSEDLIRRKILEKVATLTDHSMFVEDEETDASTSDDIDPDMVIANGSDSSSDSKIVAHSIDGDDSIIDVTMKEPSETLADEAPEQSIKPSKPIFNKRRPKFMKPGSFLEPDMQNLFDLGYFRGTKELVPTGWQQVDDDKNYPTLASRNPQPQQSTEDDYEMENGQNGSESGNDDDPFNRNNQETFSSTTRMNDESSEDELSIPATTRALPLRSANKVGQTGRSRRVKTYSRKGNKPTRKSPAPSSFDQPTPDEGPLVRLGEGIVVDWNEEAFVNLFEGDKEDTFRGRSTLIEIPFFKDTELIARRNARVKRRKDGITLDDCLNEFGKEEILSEQDTWYCPRCKEHRRATKKFELWKTPDILVMHLKRFSSNSYRRDKLDILVDFPIEGLDLSSRVLEKEDGKTEVYDLFAVDDHWGGLGGGHYTAFAKSFIDNAWYEYNDSSVSKQKDTTRVVTSSAYLLFYRRRSDIPLGGPRFQQIVDKYNNNSESSEDDIAESGEDQGLVANSSLHGSSSALTGVGAAHRPANLGFHSGGQTTTVNPRDLDGLPPYQAHDNDSDDIPLFANDASMNDGQPMPSIENGIEDEGIDMGFNSAASYNPLTRARLQSSNAMGPTWTFANIDNQPHKFISGTASEIDGNESEAAPDLDGSDVVQDASSASASSRRGRIEEFDNATPMNDDGEEFVDDNPVPDMDTENQLDTLQLHRELMQGGGALLRPEFKVSVQEDDEIEEPATEIHVEEGEGIKLD